MTTKPSAALGKSNSNEESLDASLDEILLQAGNEEEEQDRPSDDDSAHREIVTAQVNVPVVARRAATPAPIRDDAATVVTPRPVRPEPEVDSFSVVESDDEPTHIGPPASQLNDRAEYEASPVTPGIAEVSDSEIQVETPGPVSLVSVGRNSASAPSRLPAPAGSGRIPAPAVAMEPRLAQVSAPAPMHTPHPVPAPAAHSQSFVQAPPPLSASTPVGMPPALSMPPSLSLPSPFETGPKTPAPTAPPAARRSSAVMPQAAVRTGKSSMVFTVTMPVLAAMVLGFFLAGVVVTLLIQKLAGPSQTAQVTTPTTETAPATEPAAAAPAPAAAAPAVEAIPPAAEPAPTPVAAPVAEPAEPAPVVDEAAAKPAEEPKPERVAKPTRKPARPAAHAASKPAAKPAAKPASKPAKPAGKPAGSKAGWEDPFAN